MNRIWEDQTITSTTELILLLALAWHSDDAGISWPSIKRLASMTCMTDRGVYKTLSILKSKRKVQIESGGGNKTNTYRLPLNTIQGNANKPLNTVHPEPSGTVIQSFKALKGESVQSFKALKAASQNRNGEQKSIQALLSMFSVEERTAYGGNWTLRYRDCPDKFVRVLNDLQTQQKEGPIPDSWAAIADLRWREFKPETKR